MPELPEVELARRNLQRWLAGARVRDVAISDGRLLGDTKNGRKRTRVADALRGRTVRSVERRGKWLRLGLDDGRVFSHLGMTGKWVLSTEEGPLRFERLRLDVTKGRQHRSVRYVDMRIFGRFFVTKGEEDLPAWSALGPDPLHEGVDAGRLHDALSKRKLSVKASLLDQTLLAGVGNIQATEALWLARIDPRRPGRTITRKEAGALAKGILKSIHRTIDQEQGPEITYVEEPGAENPFLVYSRAGEPCPRCKTQLKKVTIAGRTTTWCPTCQR